MSPLADRYASGGYGREMTMFPTPPPRRIGATSFVRRGLIYNPRERITSNLLFMR